jgi:hypothetical protein
MKLRAELCVVGCAALAWALPSACGGDSWELDLTVRISANVQQQYEGGYPAQVVMLLDNASPTSLAATGGKAYRIATVCKAGETVTFNAKRSDSQCNAPLYVRAWLEVRDGDASAKCGSFDPPIELSGTRRTPSTSPQAAGAPFMDACGGDGQPLTLALAFKHFP